MSEKKRTQAKMKMYLRESRTVCLPFDTEVNEDKYYLKITQLHAERSEETAYQIIQDDHGSFGKW